MRKQGASFKPKTISFSQDESKSIEVDSSHLPFISHKRNLSHNPLPLIGRNKTKPDLSDDADEQLRLRQYKLLTATKDKHKGGLKSRPPLKVFNNSASQQVLMT